jgi:glycosyltransferase involved in cell wall biosynthesis
MSPAISVIVPAYQVTEYIPETLQSLREQSFRNFETIVINDGCPDTPRLEQVLEEFQGEIVYLKQPNRGVASARNAAIAASRAPLIALLDSDDCWTPDYLASQVDSLEKNPDVDVVCTDAVYFGDPNSKNIGRRFSDFFPSKGEITFSRLVNRECAVFVGVTARKESVLRAGGFDESLQSTEDFDLWLRMTHNGSRFLYQNKPLVRYRLRPESLSRDGSSMLNWNLTVFRKLIRFPDLSVEERASLNNALQREQAWLDLLLGKRALYRGEIPEAKERLRKANKVMGNSKVSAAEWLLRIAPKVLIHLVHRKYSTEAAFLG